MTTQPLDALPLWGLLLASAVLLGVSVEIGYRAGRWRHAQTPDEKEQPVGAMVASILGLLALVLAFTFSLAASRFDDRRQTVLAEANAIGTTYLRSRLLPEPQRSEIARLLREYVDLRIRGVEEGHLDEAIARSEQLHALLWAQTSAVADKDSHSIITGVFVQSLNDVIDLHAERMQVGIRSRIPLVIWAALFGLAILSMAAVGYQSGICATSRSPAMPGLVLAFAIVLALIADLDRPREGLLQVSQQAMTDVQKATQPTQTQSNQIQPLRP
ncbi:MAG TPA: hypothetical protein VJ809_09525 [Pirellulales bacterium]|nr:hypothetical protein [Pirellulales bacterium]